MARKSDSSSAHNNKFSSSAPYKAKAFHLEFLNAAQKMAWAAFEQQDVLFLLGPAGTGKAQPLDSKIYTPTGYKLMGDILIGDIVCTPTGQAKVLEVFPQGEKEIYKLIFHDGSSVECCLDHLWNVSSNSNGWKNKTVNTKYLLDNCRTPKGRRHLYIETTKPVCFERRDFLISPYLMGVLIAEGNLTNANVCFSSADKEVVDNSVCQLSGGYVLKSNGIDRRIVKTKRSSNSNLYKEELKRLNLWGLYSYEKFIPEEYLHSGVEQRLSLLQSLLDCDGTIDKRTGSVSYSTTSSKLSESFCLLVNSLGGIVKTSVRKCPFYYDKNHQKVVGRPCYQLTLCMPNDIQLFLLPRKLRLAQRRIKYTPKRILDRVEFVGRKPAQCVLIDSPCHLYLTDNFVVTHNTHLATAFAISEIISKRRQRIILTRPIVEAGESLGFLPGTFEEKVNPYMLPLFDCIGKLVGWEGPQREKIDRSLEIAPVAYLRGRTFDHSVCIFDEAQNATVTQLKLFLTRFGENSKIIVTGDPNQSDLKGPVALVEIVNKLQAVPGIGIIEFSNANIVRHPLVATILEKLA